MFPYKLLGRQLATASIGAPVFEVYLRDNQRGDYKQQVSPFAPNLSFLYVLYGHYGVKYDSLFVQSVNANEYYSWTAYAVV